MGNHPSLSRREREVAALLAEGLTDRAIAGRLFISVRTAESHVRQILNKLGFDNRSQVASWMSAAGLGASDQPARATSASTPGNLPVQLTSFIGRERELANVRRLLQRARTVTIAGPAGSGKTRLAIEAAGGVRGR